MTPPKPKPRRVPRVPRVVYVTFWADGTLAMTCTSKRAARENSYPENGDATHRYVLADEPSPPRTRGKGRK